MAKPIGVRGSQNDGYYIQSFQIMEDRHVAAKPLGRCSLVSDKDFVTKCEGDQQSDKEETY